MQCLGGHPLNPKKRFISILGWQQWQSEVSAENVPTGQRRQTLGGDCATEVEVEPQQANDSGGRGTDAHSQGGPAWHGVLHGGGAVG